MSRPALLIDGGQNQQQVGNENKQSGGPYSITVCILNFPAGFLLIFRARCLALTAMAARMDTVTNVPADMAKTDRMPIAKSPFSAAKLIIKTAPVQGRRPTERMAGRIDFQSVFPLVSAGDRI